jgi:predicted O-methyltransferase YrrM
MHPNDVPGLISAEVGAFLSWLASNVQPGHAIVELGAFKGRSTCFLAAGARPGVRVVSVDPHGLEGCERGRGGRFAASGVRAEYLRHIAGYSNVTPIRSLSSDAPLPHEPIGLLWIDGDHSPAAVANDVRRWTPLVVSGGFVVIDDYGTWHKGVDAAVAAMRRDKRWADWRYTPKPTASARRV